MVKDHATSTSSKDPRGSKPVKQKKASQQDKKGCVSLEKFLREHSRNLSCGCRVEFSNEKITILRPGKIAGPKSIPSWSGKDVKRFFLTRAEKDVFDHIPKICREDTKAFHLANIKEQMWKQVEDGTLTKQIFEDTWKGVQEEEADRLKKEKEEEERTKCRVFSELEDVESDEDSEPTSLVGVVQKFADAVGKVNKPTWAPKKKKKRERWSCEDLKYLSLNLSPEKSFVEISGEEADRNILDHFDFLRTPRAEVKEEELPQAETSSALQEKSNEATTGGAEEETVAELPSTPKSIEGAMVVGHIR
jgi:hypothetical protein